MLKGSFEDETKGNALTKKGLDTLRERERQITEAEGWGDRCALIYAEGYPDCVVAPSLAVDNGVGGTYLASDARGCRTRCVELWDDSRGRGERYDVARASVSPLGDYVNIFSFFAELSLGRGRVPTYFYTVRCEKAASHPLEPARAFRSPRRRQRLLATDWP